MKASSSSYLLYFFFFSYVYTKHQMNYGILNMVDGVVDVVLPDDHFRSSWNSGNSFVIGTFDRVYVGSIELFESYFDSGRKKKLRNLFIFAIWY